MLDKWDDKEIACEGHLLKMNKYMIKRKMDPQDFSRSKKVIRYLIARGFNTYGELPEDLVELTEYEGIRPWSIQNVFQQLVVINERVKMELYLDDRTFENEIAAFDH